MVHDDVFDVLLVFLEFLLWNNRWDLVKFNIQPFF